MTALYNEELYQLYKEQDNDPAFAHLKKPLGVATQLVPGDGNIHPKLVLVGEAPGNLEDKNGTPFIGPSGRLLNQLLRIANLSREEVWVTNVLKFRPTRNRTPTDEEVAAALPYLKREVALVGRRGCRSIVGLGRTANSAIAGASISPTAKHGSWRTLRSGWNLYVCCHPSWGLREELNCDVLRADFLQLGYDLGTVTND